MRTRLVRVRRRPKGVVWAAVFLVAAMALYIRVSLPALRKMQAEETSAAGHGSRVTREAVIDGLEVWMVSFGRYGGMSEAKVEAARYVPRGAAGYVLEDEGYSVIGAGYASETDAEKVCAQLTAAEGIGCAAESASASPVTLRMTAGSEQIAAFLEAEQTLRETAGALGKLAFSVDRGDADAEQAVEVIGTHLDHVKNAEKKLREQLADSESGIFGELLSMLGDMAGQMEEMRREKGAMAVSSRLKYCHVDFRVREIEWMNGISASAG